MIKTLRITSIIAVVLAVVFFATPAVFGVRGDKQIEQFLNSTGAIEQFKRARGDKVENKRNETSPLVKQAEAFALYLNPPPKPSTAPQVARSEPRPKSVSPKFRLVGTSRHSLHPELSLALIDEPGKGLRWVRLKSSVGHLIIEQVRDGLIVVRDGESTFELVAERPAKRSLLKSKSPSGSHITGSSLPKIRDEIQRSAEEEAAMDAATKKILAEMDVMIAEAEAIQAGVEHSEANSSLKVEDIASERQRPVRTTRGEPVEPISKLDTMRISDREARGLGRLGRRLKNIQQEPNRPANVRTASDANDLSDASSADSHLQTDLIEPNRSRLNLNDVNVPG
jgi:hypothetical protein